MIEFLQPDHLTMHYIPIPFPFTPVKSLITLSLIHILGKNGAETFFRTHVMPVIFETDSLKN